MLGRVVLCGVVLVVLATVVVAERGVRDTSSSFPPSSSELLVRLSPAAATSADTLLRRHGAAAVSPSLRVWRLRSSAAAEVLPALRRARAVDSVERDQPATPVGHLSAGDPLIRAWLTSVGADRAEPPGPGKPVTVVDSGIDMTHPEFANRPNTVALNEQRTRGRSDEAFHGTAVSSLVGAPSNGVGLVGVYPQAVLRTWDVIGGLGDVVEGIDTASRGGAGVINLSLGFDSDSSVLRDAIALAVGRGSVIVAAGGNERDEGMRSQYPASYPHVLTIAATDEVEHVTSFSNDADYIDLAAPGEDILVAVPTFFRMSGFLSASGTSFSAPIVSGATAWVWTVRPNLDNMQIFDVMRLSARDLPPAGFDRDTGFGMLDIPRALATPPPASDPLEPNENVNLIKPGGLFSSGKAGLTQPGRTSATLSARIDRREDPNDLYRVWVPARRTLVATATSAADVDAEVWRSTTASLRARPAARRRDLLQRAARRGTGAEVVRVRNAASRGAYYYVNVVAANATRQASYRLAVTTTS